MTEVEQDNFAEPLDLGVVDDPAQVLAIILKALKGDSRSEQLSAIATLNELNYSSDAIRTQLEKLAAQSTDKSIRRYALAALNQSTQRNVRSRVNKMSRANRQELLSEISSWEVSGLLENQKADVIRRRYDFDLIPETKSALQAAPVSIVTESASRVEKEAPPLAQEMPKAAESSQPVAAKTGQPSITQTLLSETSIKVFLYLGAFFVVASAMILAALIETARTPILLIATALFGGGAVILKKRLPQPSFTLFIVFSFLMPIDAGVLADQLGFTGDALSFYWAIAMFAMTAAWSIGAILYNSRFFSVAALFAFEYGALLLMQVLTDEWESFVFGMTLAVLAGGLGLTFSVKKLKDEKFALPVFVSAQFMMMIIVPVLFGINITRLFSDAVLSFPLWLYWAFALASWLMISAFYILSDELYPYVLFEYPTALALVFVPALALQMFGINELPPYVYAFLLWGTAYAGVSEWTRVTNIERLQKYYLPTLLAMFIPFSLAWGIGIAENVTYAFAAPLFITIIFAVLCIRKFRLPLWAFTLITAQSAYFIFFQIPSIEKLNIFSGFQLLGSTLLLLLPDIFLKKVLLSTQEQQFRYPLRAFGILNFIIGMLITLPEYDGLNGKASIVIGIYALFFLLYAIVYNIAWIGILFTALASIFTLYLLRFLQVESWLIVFSAQTAVYYIVGIALKQKPSWSNLFRFSALGLATIISFAALIQSEAFGGWYITVFTLLFLLEMYLRKESIFEAGALVLSLAALYMILDQFKVIESAYYALTISLFWLTLDAVLYKTYSGVRVLAWATRLAGGALIFFNTFYLLVDSADEPNRALICFAAYTVCLLVYALLYAQPVIGYSVTWFFALTIVYALRSLGWTEWFLPITALSVMYYGSGLLLKLLRKGDESKNTWAYVLSTSGIGLGILTSIIAPLKGGLTAPIPSAVTATMVTVEAFARRNVWLGFPANALYLLSYFVVLNELKVDEPQFFSVGAALLGMIMHYLLTRSGSKTAAFATGMISQLVLLSTTLIQMVATQKLGFFIVLFAESIVVLIYGLVIRSRSLVFTPILFVVLGVFAVIYGILQGLSTVVLIGCSGLIFLFIGIGAVLLRERISKLGEQLSDWQA